MNGQLFLILSCILAGFALIKVPLSGSFFASLYPITSAIGILTVLVFSCYLIFKGIQFLLGKEKWS